MPGSVPDPGRLFDLFKTIVGIDSESGSEGSISRYVKEYFAGLGVECFEDGAAPGTGGECGNLVARIPAAGTGSASEDTFILNAHLDTVEPGRAVKIVEEDVDFRSDGTTVLGADDKVGVAAILSSVEELLNSGATHRALEIVLTVQEEKNLVGAKHLDVDILSGKWGVVLDGAGPVGGIITEAPGQVAVKFEITGRSAHAGVEPESGINAIGCASRAIAGLRMGRIDALTTSNIGIIRGGHAVNIVPDSVIVEGEIRSISEERLEEEKEAMLECFSSAARSDGCGIRMEVAKSFSHFKKNRGDRSVEMVSTAMRNCGIEPDMVISGGGSDANVFVEAGLDVVPIHVGIESAHSVDERISKDQIHKVALIVHTLATMSA